MVHLIISLSETKTDQKYSSSRAHEKAANSLLLMVRNLMETRLVIGEMEVIV